MSVLVVFKDKVSRYLMTMYLGCTSLDRFTSPWRCQTTTQTRDASSYRHRRSSKWHYNDHEQACPRGLPLPGLQIMLACMTTKGCKLKSARLTLLDVGRLLVRVGSIATDHLGVLGDLDTLALDNLNVVQTGQNFVLDLELGAHGELGTLLDLEGLIFEGGLGACGGEVDSDGVSAGRVHGQGKNDAHSRVVGIRDVGTATKAEGLLVSLEGLIAGVWWRESQQVWLSRMLSF